MCRDRIWAVLCELSIKTKVISHMCAVARTANFSKHILNQDQIRA